MVPPPVVGGRLVPEPWQPNSHRELHELQAGFARAVLEVVRALSSDRYLEAVELLISSLDSFLSLTAVAEVKDTFSAALADDSVKRSVRLKLEGVVHEMERSLRPSPLPSGATMDDLTGWMRELAPGDLVARVKELTAREYWEVMMRHREKRAPE